MPQAEHKICTWHILKNLLLKILLCCIKQADCAPNARWPPHTRNTTMMTGAKLLEKMEDCMKFLFIQEAYTPAFEIECSFASFWMTFWYSDITLSIQSEDPIALWGVFSL